MINLIINGDDFGITQGVNRGIAQTAKSGILTSTSVMVNRPYAHEVTNFHQQYPKIGIGIHIEFPKDLLGKAKGGGIVEKEILESIENQINIFKQISGFMPDHMDFHKVAIRPTKTFVLGDISIFKTPVEKIAQKYHLPWRGMEGIIVVDTFHGAIYDPSTHLKSQADLNRISSENLIKILRSLSDGNYELMTHPGFVDEELTSSYAQEREHEVKALTNPAVIKEIRNKNINLTTYKYNIYK